MLWLLGAGGIGKSVLMSILTAALAGTDVRDTAHLCQQLDRGYGRNLLEAKPLVAFHEVDSGPANVIERLKSLVTENELHLAEKFKASQTIPVFTRFVMLINEYHKVVLRAEPHEQRRVLYLYTPVTYGDVGHLMSRIFEIKNDRTRAVHRGYNPMVRVVWLNTSPRRRPRAVRPEGGVEGWCPAIPRGLLGCILLTTIMREKECFCGR